MKRKEDTERSHVQKEDIAVARGSQDREQEEEKAKEKDPALEREAKLNEACDNIAYFLKKDSALLVNSAVTVEGVRAAIKKPGALIVDTAFTAIEGVRSAAKAVDEILQDAKTSSEEAGGGWIKWGLAVTWGVAAAGAKKLHETAASAISKVHDTGKAVIGAASRAWAPVWNRSDKVITQALKQDPASVFANKKFRELVVMQEFWKVLGENKAPLANYISARFLDNKPGVNELCSDLIGSISQSLSNPESKECMHNIMKHASVLMSITEKSDAKRIENLFGLLDNVIALAEKNPGSLELLKKHQDAIIEMITPHMPDGIDVGMVVRNVLDQEALAALKKAYMEYRDSEKGHISGLLNATKTMLKCPKLRALATHAMWKKLKSFMLGLVPNFMRRKHANERVNEILKQERGYDTQKDLYELCRPTSADLEPVTRHTLEARCFKGLNLPHSLNNLVIDRFNFSKATFGTNEAGSSLAYSMILDSDFSDVKFKGKTVDLSGVTIDAESLDSLLPALKGKEVTAGLKITVIGTHKGIEDKLEEAGLAGKYKIAPPEFLSSFKEERERQDRKQKRDSLSHSLKSGRKAAKEGRRVGKISDAASAKKAR